MQSSPEKNPPTDALRNLTMTKDHDGKDYMRIIEQLHSLGASLDPSLYAAAAKRGFTNIINYLKKNKVECPDQVVVEAAADGQLGVLAALLRDCSSVDPEAYIKAAANGQMDVMLLLIRVSPNVPDEALVEAAANGQRDMVLFMLGRNASIPGKAVIKAAANGHLDVVKLLVKIITDFQEEGVERFPNSTMRKINEILRGETSVGFIVGKNHDYFNEMARMHWSIPYEAMVEAARNGHLEIVRTLLDAEVEVDEEAWEAAAINGQLEIIKLFTSRMRKPQGKVVNDEVFQEAIRREHTEIVRVLLENGSYDITAEMLTEPIKNDNFKLVRLLADKIPDLNPAIEMAIKYEQPRIQEVLVSSALSRMCKKIPK